jgi:hypothetical protein
MNEMTERYHLEAVQELTKEKNVVIFTSKCCNIFDKLNDMLEVFSVKVDLALKFDKGELVFSFKNHI